MNARPIAFALLAGTSLFSGATVPDRLDRLEARVSGMDKLLRELAGTAQTQPTQSFIKPSSSGYQVKKGDSYWSIARRHKVSVSALERANPGVNPRTLGIGRTINIPGQSKKRTPISTVARTTSDTYQVKPGDILGRISEAHGIRLYQLLDANPGLDPRRLKIGAILKIPGQQKQAHVQISLPLPLPVESSQRNESPPTPKELPRPNPYLSAVTASSPEIRTLEPDSSPIFIEEPRLITIEGNRRLSEIAERYKTTVAEINQLNKRKLSPRQMIQEGSQLYMPAR